MLETALGVAILLALALTALVGYAATKPNTFSVSRSQSIKAPAERIYPLIANLKAMNTWNPFVKPDPNIKIDYFGPESGTGAKHTWCGNRNVGEGQIAIVDAMPPQRVAMKLDMVKPMTAHNDVLFTLEPVSDGTIVTWHMTGSQPLMAKVMSTVINCDRMVGGLFEKGLAELKTKAET